MMQAVVFDASAIVGFILDPPSHPLVVEMVENEACEILVPHVCDLEIVLALRSVVRRRLADADRARAALRHYMELPIERLSHLPFLDRVFEMRDNFSAYDAVYVALADAFEAPFHTADAQLARAVREHTGVQVAEV
ncbi:MAG: type II toxin-antitoxin system VapC family toxin [Gemmatimonadetes bacterium]|nr:type II toxin-antitoxin system VapC family toxin [Gemmatimonadota bacterium]